jgi:Zn-dependent M16 (insulinase) family peptidase
MHGMSAASDEGILAFASFAKDVIAKSVTRQNVMMSETASEYADISRLAELLPDGEKIPEKKAYKSSLPRRMGIEVPAAVSFAVTAYDMTSDGRRMSGAMSVGANIISLAHLWNTIRVQGGSYGASMAASRTGNLICYTYRDPSPARSLEVYKTIPEFLDAFASADDAGIDGFIISTVAQTEPLLSPAAKGRAGDDFWLSGYSDEDRAAIRREMLNTKAGDLAGLHDALADMTEKSTVCVVGPKSALETCPDIEIFPI